MGDFLQMLLVEAYDKSDRDRLIVKQDSDTLVIVVSCLK